jgi:hypothetical protein
MAVTRSLTLDDLGDTANGLLTKRILLEGKILYSNARRVCLLVYTTISDLAYSADLAQTLEITNKRFKN